MSTQPSDFSSDSVTFWLSLTTAPFLLGIIGIYAMGQTLSDWGKASEDIFLGEKSPFLHIPESNPTTSPPD